MAPPAGATPRCFGILAGERAKWALLAYALYMTTLVGGVVYGPCNPAPQCYVVNPDL